jgi:hypothetical protein
MVVVFGILLVAAGAVLFWAGDRTVGGGEASTIGVIVMARGGIGVLASLLLSARATSGRGGTGPPRGGGGAGGGNAPIPTLPAAVAPSP